MMDRLKQLRQSGMLSDVDLALAGFFDDRGFSLPELLAAVALLSLTYRQGHTSVDLEAFAAEPSRFIGPVKGEEAAFPVFGDWASKLEKIPVVGSEENAKGHPLILSGNRLYFNRFFTYERDIASKIHQLSQADPTKSESPVNIKNLLDRLFDEGESGHQQKIACINALHRNLTIITGGPGTGKTHTVLRFLAILLSANEGNAIRAAITAPTGKAAVRVRESIQAGLEGLEVPDEIKKRIPIETRTIHRLLGSRYQSAAFNHNKDNPLPYDVVIVDEASMIDLALMAKLIYALREGAKLILLGDKDQLASVESGSVFADICDAGNLNRFSREWSELIQKHGIPLNGEAALAESTGLLDSIVELRHSRRFSSGSGIGKFAWYVNRSDPDGAIEMLRTGNEGIRWIQGELSGLMDEIREQVISQYRTYLDENLSEREKLASMQKLQILCAHRKGRGGVAELNQMMETMLKTPSGQTGWYHGKPMIMTRNDYQLKVFNGDTGIMMKDADRENYMVFMQQFDEKSGKAVINGRQAAHLQDMETAWALTVHKSQGSEYDEVILVLPEEDSPVLTRELVYTAVTRARIKVVIFGKEEILRKAILRKTIRSSGLRERLWG